MRFPRVLALALTVCAGCARTSQTSSVPTAADVFTLGGQFVVQQLPSTPPQMRIGGLSGLASLRNGRELLAVADDREHPRVFRMRVSGSSNTLRVERVGIIYLQPGAAAPPKLDPEAIAITREGHLLITSEGVANEEPRLPPAILEYSSDGQFIRQLAVRSRYSPTERGVITAGARQNAAFESLALTDDYTRFFTATELPLTQDGEADAFTPGARARVLEYVAAGATYEPRREFAYEIEPMQRPPFGVRLAISGVVELLSIDGDVLLAMERAFAESTDRTQTVNRIRIFRIDLSGATDISAHDSLRGMTNVVPVRKTLLADVNAMAGLAAPLERLDNFEGMAWGPPAAGGRRSLILVSDDNFSDKQVTAFLLLRPSRSRDR